MSIVDRIKRGEISAAELAELAQYSAMAELIIKAVDGAKKKITFTLGDMTVECYDCWGVGHEAHVWAECDKEGKVTFYTNWGGNHIIFEVNVLDENELLMSTLSLRDEEGYGDLISFLRHMAGEEE